MSVNQVLNRKLEFMENYPYLDALGNNLGTAVVASKHYNVVGGRHIEAVSVMENMYGFVGERRVT